MAKFKTEKGIRTLSFRITKSSGDYNVDRLALQAADECGKQNMPGPGKIDKPEFNRKMNACWRPRMGVLMQELHDRRSGAAEGS